MTINGWNHSKAMQLKKYTYLKLASSKTLVLVLQRTVVRKASFHILVKLQYIQGIMAYSTSDYAS